MNGWLLLTSLLPSLGLSSSCSLLLLMSESTFAFDVRTKNFLLFRISSLFGFVCTRMRMCE